MTPNYKEYTLDELEDALFHIDREQFSDRTNLLIQEIKSRRKEDTKELTQPTLPEFKEDLHPNIVLRYWKGQVSLPISYWGVGVAISLLFVGFSRLIGSGLETVSTSIQLGSYILGLYIVMIALMIWQSVGVYRSAGFHPQRGGSEGWAITARVMVFVGLLSFVNQMYTSGFAIMNGAFQAITGVEGSPETQFRILNDGTDLELFGGLEVGSETLLLDQLEQHPNVKILHLHSVGGRILAAKRMVKIIRQHGLDTYVKTECASACTLLFLAGKERLLSNEGKLKFHSSSIGNTSGHQVKELSHELEKAYLNAGLPKSFVKKVIETPSDTFWEPTNDELIRYDVVDKIVDPNLYAYSGIGAESSITIEGIESGLLTHDYMVAMKQHDPDAYQKVLDINLQGMLAGISVGKITDQFVDFLYNVRLPAYLSSANNAALVEYWKVQVYRMKELEDEYPLACASFVYPEQVPAEKSYGNDGVMSSEAKILEAKALANLIKSYRGEYINLDNETQQSLVNQVVAKVQAQNEEYYKVVQSPKDFVNNPELMCAASIALSEAFISFDEDTNGELLRSLYQ